MTAGVIKGVCSCLLSPPASINLSPHCEYENGEDILNGIITLAY